jgi:hypothetical protein
MSTVLTLDKPPAGWHALDVMRAGSNSRKWDWVALMIDVHPDDLKSYRPGSRKAQQRWLHIPGKHKNKDAAWDALRDILETRH